MSRFGEWDGDEDYPNQGAMWQANRDRYDVGRKGLAMYREMEAALLAMPVKELGYGSLVTDTGSMCAVGVLVKTRLEAQGMTPEAALEAVRDTGSPDGEYYESVASAQLLDPKLPTIALEQIMYINDEYTDLRDSPERRYQLVLHEVQRRIAEAEAWQAKRARG